MYIYLKSVVYSSKTVVYIYRSGSFIVQNNTLVIISANYNFLAVKSRVFGTTNQPPTSTKTNHPSPLTPEQYKSNSSLHPS
ncbi:MAG: hypothetical protein IPM69_06935 [Ignavibacteria bacterium]|nr:hypothetical protein [Ignavibacteria bacterium]